MKRRSFLRFAGGVLLAGFCNLRLPEIEGAEAGHVYASIQITSKHLQKIRPSRDAFIAWAREEFPKMGAELSELTAAMK